MAAVNSRMRELFIPMPSFELPDTVSGEIVSSDGLRGSPAIVVAFICNHCPYVIHIQAELVKLGRDLKALGVPMVAISSNDTATYPQDGPDRMAALARKLGFEFPYLYDESQDVARAFQAACTPDFFLFDAAQQLRYRGQLDDSRPGNGKPVTGSDLRAAIEALLSGRSPTEEQKPSIGCSLKWKSGQAPDWA
jgi:peroxiredoxin